MNRSLQPLRKDGGVEVAEPESPETVAGLIAALSKFDPSDFVVAREVFTQETTRVLAVDADRERPATVVITYDGPAD
jgi:hypothetical protein